MVKTSEFRGERALVIGGSRGLGEVAVKSLAAGGAEVRFTYFKGSADAQRIVADVRAVGDSAAAFAYDVYKDCEKLDELLLGWSPTLLCYFATPVISSTVTKRFQPDRFKTFCDCYVDGFMGTFNAVSHHLKSVLYPSSSFIDEMPPNMAEYAAAKAAAESLCHFLAKTNSGIHFNTPRYSRLSTDQTASVLAVETGDAKTVVLGSLRGRYTKKSPLRDQNAPVRSVAVQSATVGPAFTVAATFTAEPIEPALRFWMSELQQPGMVKFAAYNQVFQAMLDPAGLLSRKNLGNAVLVRLEDWIEGNKSLLEATSWKMRLQPVVDELITAAQANVRASPTIVIVCPASKKVSVNASVAAVLDELTADIIKRLKGVPGVYAFGPQAVASIYPLVNWHDASADDIAKIPYTPKYFAVLGTFLSRMALAVRRSPYKVIVLDCDNTLWEGVCGEGGIAAVSVGLGFRAMQQFMSDQSAQGKILCLCSKNVEGDVWEIFQNHPDMLVRRDQFVAHRINWSPKSQNLRELAKELNVGLDSFIFLDDNPVECAEVRANCPEILTLQAPTRGKDWPVFLGHVWAFDQLTVTEQDRQRSELYLQHARREEVRKGSAGLDDFLSKLQLQVDITSPSLVQMSRVAQLTERTNQFNFSTIRRTEAELVALLKDARIQCYIVEVKDRFGDYGLVGSMITRAESKALVVDTMLLSCRVLGRGVEHRMVAFLGQLAGSAGLSLEVPFVRTKKNLPAADFLDSGASSYRVESVDGFIYRMPAEAAAMFKAKATSAPSRETEAETAQEPKNVPVSVVPYERIAIELHDPDAILAAIEAQSWSVEEAQPTDTFVEPQNDRQKQLAKIWCDLFKLKRVGIRDDYFALGGTSLMAVRLVLNIEKVFRCQIPIATLLKAPTIEKLAMALDDPTDDADLAMVTLRADGTGPPLILLFGVGGHVLKYKQLVELLATDQPVYGFEMRPEADVNRVMRPLEQMASELVGRILKTQPDGPYLLAGWSFGGVMAFEIAQQLRKLGKATELVALFDTWCHSYPRQLTRVERLRKHLDRLMTRRFAENLRYLKGTTLIQARVMWHGLMKMTGVRKTDFYQYESPETEQMVAICDAAWKDYRPSPLPGRLVLLRAMRWPDLIGLSYEDSYNGWKGLATTIEIHPIDADHLGLFDEPAVHQTAEALGNVIRAALTRSSSNHNGVEDPGRGVPTGDR